MSVLPVNRNRVSELFLPRFRLLLVGARRDGAKTGPMRGFPSEAAATIGNSEKKFSKYG
jgi:hypothetical protein